MKAYENRVAFQGLSSDLIIKVLKFIYIGKLGDHKSVVV